MGEPFHPARALSTASFERGNMRIVVGASVFRRTLLNPRFLVRRQLALHFIDDERKAGFGIGLDGHGRFLALPAADVARRADALEIDVGDIARFGDFRQSRTVDRSLCACRLPGQACSRKWCPRPGPHNG